MDAPLTSLAVVKEQAQTMTWAVRRRAGQQPGMPRASSSVPP